MFYLIIPNLNLEFILILKFCFLRIFSMHFQLFYEYPALIVKFNIFFTSNLDCKRTDIKTHSLNFPSRFLINSLFWSVLFICALKLTTTPIRILLVFIDLDPGAAC